MGLWAYNTFLGPLGHVGPNMMRLGSVWVHLGLKLMLIWTQHGEHGPKKCCTDAKVAVCWVQSGPKQQTSKNTWPYIVGANVA